MDAATRKEPENPVKPPKPVDEYDPFECHNETRKHKRIIHDYE